QIWVVRRQPPRLRAGETEACMDPPRLGIDLRLQCVGVGVLELGQLAPVEHERRAFDALAGEPLQLIHVGRILTAFALSPALEAEPAVENLAQLLGRADRERSARRFVDSLLQALDVAPEL